SRTWGAGCASTSTHRRRADWWDSSFSPDDVRLRRISPVTLNARERWGEVMLESRGEIGASHSPRVRRGACR
ncbi:MAG: hypothetical protein AAB385_01270, partial [Planctomycetota bacterium]